MNTKEQNPKNKIIKLWERFAFSEDSAVGIYEFIKGIDKKISNHEFIKSVIEQEYINESLFDHIMHPLNMYAGSHEQVRINILTSEGIENILKVAKHDKNFVSMYFNMLITAYETKHKIDITSFKDIDLNDIKNIYKFISILQKEFENDCKYVPSKYALEWSVFFSIGRITLLLEAALVTYKALGGEIDMDIKSGYHVVLV